MHKPFVAAALVVATLAISPAQAQTARAPGSKQPALFSQTSIEKGWKQATTHQQPMLVMFTSDNCLYCKKMLAETYGHPAIEQMLAANTQTVLAHADNYQALVKKLGIRGYPSSVLVSPKGDVLDFMEGFVSPKDFAKRVHPLLQAHARQARAQNTAKQTTER
ncbi:MAG: thioredoxin fold domain-containing protein [Bythopirellula sp.]